MDIPLFHLERSSFKDLIVYTPWSLFRYRTGVGTLQQASCLFFWWIKFNEAQPCLFIYYLWLLLCYNSKLNSYNKNRVALKAKNICYVALYRKLKCRSLIGVQNHWKFFRFFEPTWKLMYCNVWSVYYRLSQSVCIEKCIFRSKFGKLFYGIPIVY